MSGKAEQRGKIVDQKVNRNYSVTFFHVVVSFPTRRTKHSIFEPKFMLEF